MKSTTNSSAQGMQKAAQTIDRILFEYHKGIADSIEANQGLVGEFFGKSSEPHKTRLLCQTRSIYFLIRFAEIYDRPDVLDTALALYHRAREYYFVDDAWLQYPSQLNSDSNDQQESTKLDLYGYASLSYTECYLFEATQDDTIRTCALSSLELLSGRVLSETFYPEQCVHAGHVSQNPIMHLFESFVVGANVFQSNRFQESASRLLSIVETHFYDTGIGLISEIASPDEPSWFELGHAFEWASLIKMSSPEILSQSGLSAERLLNTAEQYCLEINKQDKQLVPAKLFKDSQQAVDSTFRIWPQLERIRANHMCGDTNRAEQCFDLLIENFFDANMLPKEYLAQTKVDREKVKTTTGYHIINGLIDIALASRG